MARCCSAVTRVKLLLGYTATSSVLHLSAAIVFGVHYHLYAVTIWAVIGGLYALSGSFLHLSTLRSTPSCSPPHILPAILLAGVLGMIFSMGVFFYSLAKAIAAKESPFDVTSHYILAVWTFLCFKWSFCLFQQSRSHGDDLEHEEDATPLVIEEELSVEEDDSIVDMAHETKHEEEQEKEEHTSLQEADPPLQKHI